MKTLILFSTRDGQTREIASYLASELKELGIQADVANVHRIEEPQWENYDRVVIGASIRYGHYHSAFQGNRVRTQHRLSRNLSKNMRRG